MISEDQTGTERNDQPDDPLGGKPPQDGSGAPVDAPPSSDTPAQAGADVPDELEQLRAQLTEAKEQALRAAAEAQNVRRRADKDVENARRFALERFVTELLPVIDNLERALAATDPERHDDSIKPVIDGVELTRKSFSDVLGRFHVTAVDPLGEPFDPQLHEAMSVIDSADAEPNSVITVVQKGYTLHDRLLRPAMVVVARG